METQRELDAEEETDRKTCPGRFRPNPDVDLIAEAMGACAIGQVMTYDHLSKLIGRDIREFRYIIAAARRRLLNWKGMVFEAVPNEGYCRLSDSQCITAGMRDIDSCRRKALRAGKKARASKTELLTPEERSRRAVVMTQAMFMARSSSVQATKKLESAVADHGLELTYQKTLALFEKKKGA
jgi:hypothetical protein